MEKEGLEKIVDEFIDNDWGKKARWLGYFGIDRREYLKKSLKGKAKRGVCYLIRRDDGFRLVEHPLNEVLCELSNPESCLGGYAMKKYRIEYQDTILRKPKTAFVCIGRVLYKLGLL